ncbi:telomerase reverse transcriptase, putative [Babesia caballi]|uniref:Telomerase reverse transcriptase, putative n=1 Tax=Babesia caballi TaxID=5871 RepID=A0AAV4LSA8_BABCB|nr:telomerase reverse transcriptase, putative [Babesia caballi]
MIGVGKVLGKGGTCDSGCQCGGSGNCAGNQPSCTGEGGCSGSNCSGNCCGKDKAPYNPNSLITGSSVFSLFIAFFSLIAIAIYFLQHVNFAPSLKAAFKCQ